MKKILLFLYPSILFLMSCQHQPVGYKSVQVDSFVIERPPPYESSLCHSFILKDSVLKMQTKHTGAHTKIITNQSQVDSFITYAKEFYTEPSVEREGFQWLQSDYMPAEILIAKGYKNQNLVLADTTYVTHYFFHDDYYLLLGLLHRLSVEYEREKDKLARNPQYPDNVNKYDTNGQKTGKWIYKGRHRVIVANYTAGKLDGQVKRYSPRGQLTLLRHYKMGTLVKAYSYGVEFNTIAVYNKIKKSDVKVIYSETYSVDTPVNYKAQRTNYSGNGWWQCNNYYYDMLYRMDYSADIDTVTYFKNAYNVTENSTKNRTYKNYTD